MHVFFSTVNMIFTVSMIFKCFFFSFIPSETIEDEDGEFRCKEDREHRHTAETEKLRITWNTERRCYMDNAAEKRLNHIFLLF